MNWVVVSSTGQILRLGTMPVNGPDQPIFGTEVFLKDVNGDPSTEYWDGANMISRPFAAFDKLAITADGIGQAGLSLGESFDATINGQVVTVADGSLEVMATAAGSYKIEVDHFPWQPLSVLVVAS